MAAKQTYLSSLDVVCQHAERDRTDQDGVRHLCRIEFDGKGCSHATQRTPMDRCKGFKGTPTAGGKTAKRATAAALATVQKLASLPCIHLGEPIRRDDGFRETVPCVTCGTKPGETVSKAVYACAVHGQCTTEGKADGVASCVGCPDHSANLQASEAEEAHRKLMDKAVVDALASPPLTGEGRGIVTCAGGSVYFASAYIMVSVLRKLGCTLPVEWWYLGKEEMDPRMIELAESLGNVTTRDAVAFSRTLPVQPRNLQGWESKAFVLLYSRFAECLFLDADQVPVLDPAYLFDNPRYREVGAMLWPDLLNDLGYDVTVQAFRTARVPVPGKANMPGQHKPTGYRPVESGQVLIDRTKRGAELRVAWHICDYSDYWFRRGTAMKIFGDKSAFFFGFERTGQERSEKTYIMPRDCTFQGSDNGGAFQQHDMDGKMVFQHRCQPVTKWALNGENKDSGIVNWKACMAALATLRDRWPGEPWLWKDQSLRDTAGASEKACGDWWYMDGDSPKRIRLLQGGRIDGLDDLHWTFREGDLPFIVLADAKHGKAFLYLDNYGNWIDRDRGRSLIPGPPATWKIPVDQLGTSLWSDIVVLNEYRLPDRFVPDDVVFDIGAHVGIFTKACLNRGASVVHAVEPNKSNFAMLAENVGSDPRVRLYQAAAWDCETALMLDFPDGGKHSGGGCIVDMSAGQEVKTVVLDELIGLAKGNLKLIKLDCESAEWNLLRTSKRIWDFERIVGEYHLARMPADCSVDALRTMFVEYGFNAEIVRSGESLGHFFAVKNA